MIRLVNSSDFELTKSMMESLIKDSVYSFMFKDYVLTQKMFDFYITNPKERVAVFILDEAQKEVGIGVFDIVPWYNHDAPLKIARMAYLYVLPEERGKGYGKEIKNAFEYWGKTAGATHYSTSRKLEDYKKVETIYMKEV